MLPISQEKILHRKTKVTVSDRILAATFLKLLPRKTTPNQLTIFRYFSVPFVVLFLYLGHYKIGIVLFVISAFTDALDGALARTTNRVTTWGEENDPIADKALIGLSALIVLPRFFDFWLVFSIIFMEVFLVGMAYYQRNRGRHISANGWGKAKMVLQSVGVGLLLLYALVPVPTILLSAQYTLYASIFFAAISIITYGI